MILRLATLIFIVLSTAVYGQSVDSLVNKISPLDTLSFQNDKLDSIQSAAAQEYSDLKNQYDSVMSVASVQVGRLNQRIDSLQTVNLPTNKVTHQLDSVMNWKDEDLHAITAKVDNLKSRVNEKVNGLDLPPPLQAKAGELTAAMDKLDVKLPNSELPLSFQNSLGGAVPSLANPLQAQGLPQVNGLDLPSTNIESVSGVTDQVQQYQGQLGEVPTNLDDAGKLAEQQATKIDEVGNLQKEIGQVGEVTGMAEKLKDGDAVKQELVSQAQHQAVDHFAGKQEQLEAAMNTLAKYKKKYSSLESLSDIPKRRPNDMRGRPLVERLVPSITLQIFRKDDWMTDFNGYVGYRFNPRLTVGAGWNQRMAYNFDAHQFSPQARVYGPRSYGEFQIAKGISGHLNIEYLNTWVPNQFSSGKTDGHGREWVFSTMAGVKKDYRLIKSVKGTFYLLYNFYDPHHRSPYADRLNVRMGFEFPMKKRVKDVVGDKG